MTAITTCRLWTVQAFSLMLLLVWVGIPAEAARPSRGLGSFSAGYRFESGTLKSGPTANVSGDTRLHKGIALFGAVDLHGIKKYRRWSRAWRGGSSMGVGVGGFVGFRLRVRPRDPGLKLSPGVAVGLLVLPSEGFGPGQFGTVRFSMDLAVVPEEGAGLLLEASAVQVFSGVENSRYSYPDPLISIRLGLIIRSF